MPSWSPRAGEDRQKDHTRTNARAKRMRADQTSSEQKLWTLLRQLNREGASFRRQAAIGDWVFDFADYSAHLLIEVDGVVHRMDEVAMRDAAKEAWARSQGFILLRIPNNDVWNAPDRTLDRIRATRKESAGQPSPLVGEAAAQRPEGGRSGESASTPARKRGTPPTPNPSPQGGGERE
ncbi:MAG: endonuclease domain-containing protein [Hyphomonadaceae bacterium]